MTTLTDEDNEILALVVRLNLIFEDVPRELVIRAIDTYFSRHDPPEEANAVPLRLVPMMSVMKRLERLRDALEGMTAVGRSKELLDEARGRVTALLNNFDDWMTQGVVTPEVK